MAHAKRNVNFVARKKVDSGLVNFIALVAGMVTTLFIALSIWNYFTAVEKVDRTLNATADNGENGNAESTRISSRDFDQILANGTAPQLEELLVRLNNWNREANLSVRISENLKRAKVANQMLTLPLSKTQRTLAIDSQIAALSAVYGLDLLNNLKIPDVGANLLAAAKNHREDPDPNLARTARLAIVKVETYEFIKTSNPESNFEPFISNFVTLLHDYPGDDLVLSNVKLMVFSMHGISHELGLKLMRLLSQHESEFSTKQEKRFFRELRDETILLESNLERLMNDRWVNGKAGQREMLKTILALSTDPNGAEIVLKKVDMGANWFEQINELESARSIYQGLLDSATVRKDPKLADLARQLGERGLRRCDLVGQPIDFASSMTLGGEFDVEKLANQIVIIVFWSNKSESSMKMLENFSPFANELQFKQAMILAYSIDSTREPIHQQVAKRFSGYQFVDSVDRPASSSSLLVQCPVSDVPQAVIVDHRGIVADANVPLDELQSAIEFLMIKRSESN